MRIYLLIATTLLLGTIIFVFLTFGKRMINTLVQMVRDKKS